MRNWAVALIVLILGEMGYCAYISLKVINDPTAELGALLFMAFGAFAVIYYSILLFVLGRYLNLNRLSKVKLIIISLLTILPFLLLYTN